MKRLQVLINGEWQYVFCKNELRNTPITTKDKSKAIREKYGDGERILESFKRQYGNLNFKLV